MSERKTDYTRDELIAICERAVVPESSWRNRDTQRSQARLGEAWAMLRAGCLFRVCVKPDVAPSRHGCYTDDRTIWIEVESRGFSHFDHGGGLEVETYYLPTPARLDAVDGRDWY